jgi:hypothetical protein
MVNCNFVWIAICVAFSAGLSGCDAADKPKPTGTRKTAAQVPNARTSDIPLESIISTSGQAGLQATTSGAPIVGGKTEYVSPNGEALQHFLEVTKGQGASNVFLVDAPNGSAAITASGSVFAGYRSADTPANLDQPKPPRGNQWLVVFVGISGSNPVRWIVDSVTLDAARIRFNYHKNPIGVSTDDIHYYYFWVPTGNLSGGAYNLELYETELKAVTLMRRVEVK